MQKKLGFTLAEVLITLAIIGVVAAMSIPSLLTTINSKVRANKITVFEKKLKQGMDLLNTQNGIGPYYENTRQFVEALGKHMKIVAICNKDELNKCMPYDKIIQRTGTAKNVNSYKTGTDFGLISDDTNDYTSDTVGVIFGDGTPMLIQYNLKCPASDPDSRNDNSTACISGLYDINGSKGPNKRGEDVLAFNGGWGKVFTPTPLTYDQCMSVKDKLGIKACCPVNGTSTYDHCSNKDYWAGAVKTCGGVQNMPTMEQLAALTSQLYRIDNGDGTYSSITIEPYKRYARSDTLAANLANGNWSASSNWIDTPGLIYNGSSGAAQAISCTSAGFDLWSGREGSASRAYRRYYTSTFTDSNALWRGNSGHLGVCLGE